MQLDLQSVEKVPFSTFSLELLPRKCWKFGLPRRRMTWNFLQDLSGAVPGFFGGPVAGNHRQHFFDRTGLPYDNNPPSDRKKTFFFDPMGDCYRMVTQFDRKSADDDFLQLGPRRSREQPRIDLGENSKSFCGEEDRISSIFGAKVRAKTYWRVLFQRTANPTAYELAMSYRFDFDDFESFFILCGHSSWSSPRGQISTCTAIEQITSTHIQKSYVRLLLLFSHQIIAKNPARTHRTG